jgi:hypothetical protein
MQAQDLGLGSLQDGSTGQWILRRSPDQTAPPYAGLCRHCLCIHKTIRCGSKPLETSITDMIAKVTRSLLIFLVVGPLGKGAQKESQAGQKASR